MEYVLEHWDKQIKLKYELLLVCNLCVSSWGIRFRVFLQICDPKGPMSLTKLHGKLLRSLLGGILVVLRFPWLVPAYVRKGKIASSFHTWVMLCHLTDDASSSNFWWRGGFGAHARSFVAAVHIVTCVSGRVVDHQELFAMACTQRYLGPKIKELRIILM